MTEVIRAAAALQSVCQASGWRFCFIGGLAVPRWGEARETVDVDLTLLTGFQHEQRFIETLLKAFAPHVPDAAAFAVANRVLLLLRASSGVGLDIALGELPFEEAAIERSTMFDFPPDVPLRTCSAEDLLVLKAFADRPKDWLDIDGVLVRQPALDWDYIVEHLTPLTELKDAPELLDRLARRRREMQS